MPDLMNLNALSAECAVCRQSPLTRSTVRWYECWREVVLGQQPFRCVRCGRRVWMRVSAAETTAPVSSPAVNGEPPPEIDLTLLDGFATDTDPSPDPRVSSLPM